MTSATALSIPAPSPTFTATGGSPFAGSTDQKASVQQLGFTQQSYRETIKKIENLHGAFLKGFENYEPEIKEGKVLNPFLSFDHLLVVQGNFAKIFKPRTLYTICDLVNRDSMPTGLNLTYNATTQYPKFTVLHPCQDIVTLYLELIAGQSVQLVFNLSDQTRTVKLVSFAS